MTIERDNHYFVTFRENPGSFWEHQHFTYLTREETGELADALNIILGRDNRRSGKDRRRG